MLCYVMLCYIILYYIILYYIILYYIILYCLGLQIIFITFPICSDPAMTESQPTVFLSHGAGPSFFISVKESPQFKGLDKDSAATGYFKSMISKENVREPKAILVISAHWEERVPTVQTTVKPSLYYDYNGFPEATYHLSWPAPGAPDVAMRAKTLLESFGFKCNTNGERGFDHGVFVPLILIYPEAHIPGMATPK